MVLAEESIKSGAEINATEGSGRTPLNLATQIGRSRNGIIIHQVQSRSHSHRCRAQQCINVHHSRRNVLPIDSEAIRGSHDSAAEKEGRDWTSENFTKIATQLQSLFDLGVLLSRKMNNWINKNLIASLQPRSIKFVPNKWGGLPSQIRKMSFMFFSEHRWSFWLLSEAEDIKNLTNKMRDRICSYI